MDVKITKSDGSNSITLEHKGIIVQDFIVSSVPVSGIYGVVEGRSGVVDYGATYGVRTIEIPFYIKASDYHDFPLLRDVLYEITTNKEPVYISEMRRSVYQTGENKLVGGKRYLVRISGEYSIEQMFKYGFGTLMYETVALPFAESVGTSQDLQRDGISVDSELWGYGMGLLYDDESTIYTHNVIAGQPFRIFNAGNVPIHPFEQKLKITISNVVGSTDRFQITNLTNGSRARINVPLRPTDKVIYDGPNVTRNNLAFLRDTRKDFIDLSPGWNEFNIYFCDRARIEFDCPFYYM